MKAEEFFSQLRQSALNAAFLKSFAAMDRVLARPFVWLTTIASLLALQSWHVLTHIAWSDEWQALFIALQSRDLDALLANLRYEGHPPLWFLVLRVADLVLPWRAILPSVQLLIALGMQWLILWRCPFSRAERLLLALSYFILFEYGALSRSLSLGALCVIAFFALRGRIVRWCIVILLPMIDFQFGLLSVVGVALLVRDRAVWMAGTLLWLVSGLVAAWTVLPATDMATSQGGLIHALIKLVTDFSALLVPIQTLDGRLGWSGGWPWGQGLIGGPLFIWFALAQTRNVPLHKWLFRFFLIGTCLFSLAVYSLSIRHLTLIALLVILLKWREAEQGRPIGQGFRLWLFCAALCGIGVTAISATRPFDSAPLVARYIRTHGLEGKNWVAWRPERGMTVGVQLGREFAMVRGGCTHSFIRWNFRDDLHSETALVNALKPFVARYGRSYLVTTLPPAASRNSLLRFMHGFEAGYNGYPYYLYIVGPDLPDTPRRPPPCQPDRAPLS